MDLYYRVSIKASGAAFDLSPNVSSLLVEEDQHNPDMLTVNMGDPHKVFSHAFQEGMEVEVDLGTVDDHSIMFRGRIYSVDGDFPQAGVPRLTIRAYDNSMKMGLRERNRTWQDKTLSDIVRGIATEHGFVRTQISVLGDPRFEGNGLRQQDETDLAFLRRLAEDYGCEMFVSADDAGDKLHFVSQHTIMTEEPPITLYHGRRDVTHHLLSFQPSSNVNDIRLPRVFVGMNFKDGTPTEPTEARDEQVAETEDRFFDANLADFAQNNPVRARQLRALITAAPTVQKKLREELGSANREVVRGFTTAEMLAERAKNQFSTSIEGMRASGRTHGTKNMHAQSSVGIEDVGGRFSGTWYLSQVRHVLNRQGYFTEFQCQR